MISVIIPIYNAAPYLPEMLQSLLEQTERDLEILLINDGSTDSSADICKAAAQEDARIRYVFQQNAGVSAARNRALTLAKGEYIAFLDADDGIDLNYFEQLSLACRGADISVCDISVETRDGEQQAVFSAGNQSFSAPDAMNLLLTRKDINSGPCGKLFRRETIADLKFPPLCFCACRKCDLNFKNRISLLPKCRKRDGSTEESSVSRYYFCNCRPAGVHSAAHGTESDVLLYHSVASLSICAGT